MKTLYIFLTRSGTLVSNLVYALTGAEYTHISIAFDENLNTLYSSTRKNGYTMFPAGPSREYLNKGVFRLRENIPCALYALEVSDEAYARAKRRAEHMMTHGRALPLQLAGAAALRVSYPLEPPPPLFLLPVRQRGAAEERLAGLAQAQHPHAPQRLRRPAPAEMSVSREAGRSAPAAEHGDGRDGKRHRAVSGGLLRRSQERGAEDVLIF